MKTATKCLLAMIPITRLARFGQGANLVQFPHSTFNIVETAGTATVTVVRTGDTNGVVTVDFSTVDGTAKAGSDYVSATGTLAFQPGETSQTFAITIRLGRLNPDGSLDTTFDLGKGDDPGKGGTGVILSLARQDDGKILLAGSFTLFDGAPRVGLARINPQGSLDTNFAPVVYSDDPITTVTLQTDGRILLAGARFYSSNKVVRTGVVRLNSDGSLDESFDAGAGPGSGEAIPPISTLLPLPDGSILAGGDFATFDGVPVSGLVRLHGDPPPRLAVPLLQADTGVQLTVRSLPGRAYALEGSSDMQTWLPLRTNTATGFTLQLVDSATPSVPYRFYRARQFVP